MSEANDITNDESAMEPVSKLNDFSDRLSPIVVKEMRQGLRQASFVILFLFLQSILAMVVISSLFAVSSGTTSARMQTGVMISSFFFALFSLAALVIQPLRGLNALSSEIKDSTIDLLLLTKLDAWRIVFGKWLSLNTQSGLLLVAVIPYLMMRYFLGGMNLIGELITLAFIFILGAMASAAAVGMSAVRSVILRSIFALGGIIAFIVLLQGLFQLFQFYLMGRGMGMFGGFSSNDLSEWLPLLIGALLLIGFLTHSFLEFGATRIAPPSENRSSKKRIIALVALIVIPLIMALCEAGREGACYFAVALIIPLALADSLSENPLHVRPMKGKDLWMLRPGWPSGALFGLILILVTYCWMIALAYMGDRPSYGYQSSVDLGGAQFISILAMIFTQPVLFIALFRPYEREPANLYMASMLGIICLGLVVLMVASTADNGEEIAQALFFIFPILGFGTLNDPSIGTTSLMFFMSCLYLIGGAAIGYKRWHPQARVASLPSESTST